MARPTAKAALEQARDTEYDVILLDMMMPELNGLSVLKELRKKGNPAAILMVSSQSHETDKLAGLNSGADHYIVKPFMVTELIARIRAVLRRRQPTGRRGRFHAADGGRRPAGSFKAPRRDQRESRSI